MSEVLNTQSLRIGYTSTVPILSNLNLSVKQGDLHILVGLNGAGKSTLLKTLAGILPPLDGEIRLQNQSLKQLSEQEKARNLSVVLTHNDVGGYITVREMVQLGRYPYTNWMATLSENDKIVIDEAIELTGLSSIEHSYFHELSDGQRQKAIIARAIAQDTPVIILDEPTTHLDIGNKVEIMKLLLQLAHQKKKSIIMSTHDIELATKMADQLWVVENNKLLTDIPEQLLINGTLDEIFSTEGFQLSTGEISLGRIRKTPVRLHGEETELKHQTEQALKRLGYLFSEEKEAVTIRIIENQHPEWQLENESFKSLSALIHHLQSADV